MINLKTNCKRTFKYKAYMGFPDGTLAKNQLANAEDARDTGLIPGGEDPLKKEMATHCSILAWKIPWTEEPDGLRSMGSQRVGHD